MPKREGELGGKTAEHTHGRAKGGRAGEERAPGKRGRRGRKRRAGEERAPGKRGAEAKGGRRAGEEGAPGGKGEKLIVLFAVEFLLLLADAVVGDIVIVLHQFVDDAIGRQLDDAVGHGLDELMVVRGEEDVALI